MLVRTATAADAASIAQIHVETWRVAYRGQIPDAVLNGLDVGRRTFFWQERLSQGSGAVFVAEDGDSITGFCDLVPSRDKDADARTVAEIVAIYILPQHWRKGTAGRFAIVLWRQLADKITRRSHFGSSPRTVMRNVFTKQWASVLMGLQKQTGRLMAVSCMRFDIA